MSSATYKSDDYRNLHIDTQPQLAPPSMYNVWLINNDKIPSDLFLFIFEEFFHYQTDKAVESLSLLRMKGHVVFGYFTREIAENKVMSIIDFSHNNNYHLKCIMCKDG